MHASSQHTKAELLIQQGKDLISSTDILLKKTEQDYQGMQERIAAQEQADNETHAKLDNEIRSELQRMSDAADDYVSSVDSLEEV